MKELLRAEFRNSTIVLYENVNRYVILLKNNSKIKRISNFINYNEASMSFREETEKAGEYEASSNTREA